MFPTPTTVPPPITHPSWCVNHPEDDTLVRGDCVDRHAPHMGEHVGEPYHLAAGETAAYLVEVTAVDLFEVLNGSVLNNGPMVCLRLRDRELCGAGETAYLTLAEVERLRRLLELCAADIRMAQR